MPFLPSPKYLFFCVLLVLSLCFIIYLQAVPAAEYQKGGLFMINKEMRAHDLAMLQLKYELEHGLFKFPEADSREELAGHYKAILQDYLEELQKEQF